MNIYKCDTCGDEISEEDALFCTDCGLAFCVGGRCERENCENNEEGTHTQN